MAELTQGRVDIISRENGTLISQSTGGSSQTINLTEPSVVRISGTRNGGAVRTPGKRSCSAYA